jgi:protein-tyrosine phosphatase
MMVRPIADSYWVQPEKLLAGEYPGSRSEDEARHKLRRLLAAGVTYCLDLTEAGEHGLKPDVPLLLQEAAALGHTVEHHRLSIPDGGTPMSAGMVCILDAIDAALEAGQVVYVHCYGGIGRTGTVVGCYLARHGMRGEDALVEIARLREGTPDGRRRSPETREQEEMVRHWPIDQTRSGSVKQG